MKKSTVSKPIYLLSLLCWLSLSGACQKEKLPHDVKTVEEARQVIIGEWEWERTEINYRGQDSPVYETPSTENKTIQYTFRKNGTVVRVENGSDFINYNFEIEQSLGSSDFHLTLSPINEDVAVIRTFLIFYNGNLILTNRLGSSSYYTRKKTK